MHSSSSTSATRAWLKSFVIAYNICPFAGHVYEQQLIRYAVVLGKDWEKCLGELVNECQFLDANPDTETTLLILPDALPDFDGYLDFLSIAQQLLLEQGYEGIYQLASFHPHYCFAGNDESDTANYTNRSPFPMLHIIRESSIEQALDHYPDPDSIPRRNIQLTRKLGRKKLQDLLDACYRNND